MNSYLAVWKKYVDFKGRAGRSEFWIFTLVNVVIMILLTAVNNRPEEPNLIMGLFALAIILPSFAVTARRMHDIDRSGWWQLVSLIPMVGGIALLVMCALKGVPGANRFGEPPAAQPGA